MDARAFYSKTSGSGAGRTGLPNALGLSNALIVLVLFFLVGCRQKPRIVYVPLAADTGSGSMDGSGSGDRTDAELTVASSDPTGQVCQNDAQCDDLFCHVGHCVPPGFAFIPSGTFWQGATSNIELARYHERPHRPVTISRDYLLSVDLVTQNQWASAVGTFPSEFRECGGDCPVGNINFYDAIYFANQRSISDGFSPCYRLENCENEPGLGCRTSGDCAPAYICRSATLVDAECDGYRLPTAAEYEYAARASDNGFFAFVPIAVESEISEICRHRNNADVSWNYASNCDWDDEALDGYRPCGPEPVTSSFVNDWGIRGPIGNAFLWVWDGWDPLGYVSDDFVDPVMASVDGRQEVRGGSFTGDWTDCRPGARGRNEPDVQLGNFSMRLLRRLSSASGARCADITLPGGRCPMLVVPREDSPEQSVEQRCASEGLTPFTIRNQAENEFLGRYFDTFSPDIDAQFANENWRNAAGTPLSYFRTDDGFRDSGRPQCAALLPDGIWRPVACASASPALCAPASQ